MSAPPVIGITVGDPLGIGGEVVVKALADPKLRERARFVIYGRNDLLTLAADHAGIHPYWFRLAHESDRAAEKLLAPVTVLDFEEESFQHDTTPGPSRAGGRLSKQFVEHAVADAMLDPAHPRHLDAIVTAPICKESWSMAGFRWPGHTELLANRTKAKRHAMAFVSPRLRVVLATAHLPLMDVKNLLTIGRVHESIDLGHELCQHLGIAKPRIAVCGLNPHAGENGLLGDEEQRIIAPAIQVAREHGVNATGPFPADTLFISAASGEYDLVVAMYHDQGLTPVKLLGWDKAVNITVGLPTLRTSPDHGTAFDIAGQDRADAGSMKAAVALAVDLAQQRLMTATGT
ncbi:MAG: 4-hydroxythreonine-4-phosphate dehydrogenase PdxA [Phycisphaerales bacterium]|nr:4-hydroxythreonine-4-phosphate dehydrogenase PdxA [Phycisphaerales bacterium]